MHGVLWFYQTPNLVLKNSEDCWFFGLNQTTVHD
jgi:hypothetical protein